MQGSPTSSTAIIIVVFVESSPPSTVNWIPRLTGTGSIRVVVQDTNDHSPVFLGTIGDMGMTVHVAENAPAHFVISQLTATDADAGINAKSRYSLRQNPSGFFHIDEHDATLTALVSFDREVQPSFDLVVAASDSSLSEPRTTLLNVTVLIDDLNDNAPAFDQDRAIVYLPDPTEAGGFVFGARVHDPDDGRNGVVTFQLTGQDADKFYVEWSTGIIRASKRLTGERYTLEVQATDQGQKPFSTSMILDVLLKPAQEFPVFTPFTSNQPMSFVFPESTVDTEVVALSARSPKYNTGASDVTFHLMAGGEGFKVDSSSGRVYIEGGLDYEAKKQYEVWIEARDSDVPALGTTIRLEVNVTDVNDNQPVFGMPVYNASIMEEQYPPQSVLQVQATDRDSGKNAEISYRLKPSEDGEIERVFEIDAETGEIFTKVQLDLEEVDFYSLTVEAFDHGLPAQLTSSALVLVTVLDKNDNPPRFTRLFSVNVTENAPVGSFVIQVRSSDRDIGFNANASYSFTENPGNLFEIDPGSGNVTVVAPIDREVKDEYLLKVSAVDGSWRAETPLTINVLDQNDNAPLFSKDMYQFRVPELTRNVAFIGKVKATDKDKHGPNSAISYVLRHPSDFFSIDASTGEILSKQPLQYKSTSRGPSPENEYSLNVIATDQGKPPLSSEARVTVTVIDQNNNRPKFEQHSYFGPVPETTPAGIRVLRIKANDPNDSGPNAEIEYTKIGGNGSLYFDVDSKSGWISVANELLGRQNLYYQLVVRASDHGIPSLQDEVSVTFLVTGENSFSPSFSAPNYRMIIPENEPVGSAILTVSAIDNDSGPNGIIRYGIAEGDLLRKFKVDPKSGTIYVNESLDFDKTPEYSLEVVASDSGFHARTTKTVVKILLTDVNDNPPVFAKPLFVASVKENSPVDTEVFTLSATDADSGRNAIIAYSIVGGNGKDFFQVNSQSGLITTRSSFDYETVQEYTLDIVASNPDNKQFGSAQVLVKIVGENEFFPKFVQSVFQFTVSESAQIGTRVGLIEATDQDAGEDGEIFYLFVGSSNDKGFSIRAETGEILVARDLDRESQSRVVLTVMAKNRGSIRGNDTDEAQVIISIKDGNDPPVFQRPIYRETINEDADLGTEVVQVFAIDNDVRIQNKEFIYTILEGDPEQVFKVHPQRGVVEIMKSLDREKVAKYDLVIGAVDYGIPPQTGTTLVFVTVGDVNDNPPILKEDDLIGHVTENEPAGVNVLTLRATDPDLPVNGPPFSYRLVGGKHSKYFEVNGETGVIRTTREVDHEVTSELEIEVEAKDNGRPRMKAVYTVKVLVKDENDSPSSGRSVAVDLMAWDGDFPGGFVAEIKPNDPDSVGDYSCRLVSGSRSLFSIPSGCNLHAGRIERGGSYSLTISGNDGRHPDVTSAVTLRINAFDQDTLDNGLTLRVYHMTTQEFLTEFYKGVLQVLRPIADSVLLSHHQERNFSIAFDPCQENPCEHDGFCQQVLSLNTKETVTVDSPDVILTTPLIRRTFGCLCTDGFTGERCSHRKDPCDPNPCEAGGTCTRHGNDFTCSCPPTRAGDRCEVRRSNACDGFPCENGGTCRETPDGLFFCICRPGYRGNSCEITAESCRPNPCLNGGTCLDLRPGYRCQCPPSYFGKHCEDSSFGFGPYSYMTFSSLDPTTNDLALTFASNKPNSLLVYNFGQQSGGRSDFVALELVNGKPKFSFGGSRTVIASVEVDRYVADGQWHKVTATRNGRVISLSVATCSQNGDSCEECTPGNPSCYKDSTGFAGTLNFNGNPMFVGGIDTIDHIRDRPSQVGTNDFVGCVQSLSVNGRTLNMSSPERAIGVSDTCGRMGDPCLEDTCGENALCYDRWDRAICRCPNGLIANDCSDAFKPVSITGAGFIQFEITEKLRRSQLVAGVMFQERWRRAIVWDQLTTTGNTRGRKTLSLKFRTLDVTGLLLYSATGQDYTLLELRDGLVHYTSRLSSSAYPINMTLHDLHLADGTWHNLTVVRFNQSVFIEVDGQLAGDELEATSVHDFLDAYLTDLSLGGASAQDILTNDVGIGFRGCVSTFTINGEVQALNGTGSVVDGSLVGFVEPGCTSAALGASASADPLSVGVTLVIVFFVILFVAILASFVVFRFRRSKRPPHSPHHHDASTVPHFKSPLPPVTTAAHLNHHSMHPHSSSGSSSVISRHQNGSGPPVGVSFPMTATGPVRGGPHAHQDSGYGGEVSPGSHEDLIRRKQQRPPDILERDMINKSPASLSLHMAEDGSLVLRESPTLTTMGESEAAEHYDLENASSIAPSDIDIVYHYKGYREARLKATALQNFNNQHSHHSPAHGPSPLSFARDSPRAMLLRAGGASPATVGARDSPNAHKMQSTPLARLSPSSEMSQPTPRILTLQDISGKPLQRALLASTPAGAGIASERSLNSPVSHLTGSGSSGSMNPGSSAIAVSSAAAQMVVGPAGVMHLRGKSDSSANRLTPTRNMMSRLTPDRFSAGPGIPLRNSSSLLNTLDAVSSSSDDTTRGGGGGGGGKRKKAGRRPANGRRDSSSDESGNDSFSEYDCDGENSYEKVDSGPPTLRRNPGGGGGNHLPPNSSHSRLFMTQHQKNDLNLGTPHHIRAGSGGLMAQGPPNGIREEGPPPYPSMSSFGAPLSKLVDSEEEYKMMNGGSHDGPPMNNAHPATWDYLLNWGPNFDNLAGVFKDIAALPDDPPLPPNVPPPPAPRNPMSSLSRLPHHMTNGNPLLGSYHHSRQHSTPKNPGEEYV
ncbi:unnamed protein product [Cyprideis torosa]|uniref:Uncharacterized protein n=1 Tax=Cyprideis torosa TaxID=163714 RepID=A0A7R8W403_9CRUS|nr:unnamed protein product [Cyprideis torosa]CAG0879406.1 unnamed protein product [Cyprideis torosa]